MSWSNYILVCVCMFMLYMLWVGWIIKDWKILHLFEEAHEHTSSTGPLLKIIEWIIEMARKIKSIRDGKKNVHQTHPQPTLPHYFMFVAVIASGIFFIYLSNKHNILWLLFILIGMRFSKNQSNILYLRKFPFFPVVRNFSFPHFLNVFHHTWKKRYNLYKGFMIWCMIFFKGICKFIIIWTFFNCLDMWRGW